MFYPYSSVGVAPQDLKYKGERSRNRSAIDNQIREFVTIHRGTQGGGMLTTIGSHNLILQATRMSRTMSGSGTMQYLSHGATLGGHVEIGDWAVVGASFRSSSVLPCRPARDDRRIQRGDAGCSAVLDNRQRARNQDLRREPHRDSSARGFTPNQIEPLQTAISTSHAERAEHDAGGGAIRQEMTTDSAKSTKCCSLLRNRERGFIK